MSFIDEFKRRNVFKVGVAYAIVSWLLIQVADTLLPAFEAPGWVLRVFFLLVMLGFPLAILLAWAFELTPQGIRPTSAVDPAESTAPQTGMMLNYTILCLLVLAVGFLLLDRYAIGGSTATIANVSAPEIVSPARAQRLSLVLPQEASIVFGWRPGHSLAISPDGQTVAFAAAGVDEGPNQSRLYVRELNSLAIREIESADNPRQPFFSPDGQWIGFFNENRELKKVSLDGGPAITLAGGLNGAVWGTGTWLADQRIVFSTRGDPSIIQSVSADGGEVTDLTELDPANREIDHITGTALPDTNTVLFTTLRDVENSIIGRIEVLDVDTGERRLVLENAANPQYLDSGHLVFSRDDVPMVAPFDQQQLAVTGPALPLRDALRRDGASGQGRVPQLAVSRSGTLAYVPPINTLRRVYRVSRDGSSEALAIRPDRYDSITVSPDARYATLQIASGGDREIWLHDFERATTTRLSQAETEQSPAWYPQSDSLVVTSTTGGGRYLMLRNLGGTERRLMEFTPNVYSLRNGSWHPDGRQLAITRQQGSEHDILLLQVDADADTEVTSAPLIVGPTIDHSPRFSPDGRWLAYVSNRGDAPQVYIRRYPDGEELIASTGDRAFAPEWSRDGSELYFLQSDDSGDGDSAYMTAVTVTEAGGRLTIDRPVALFPIRSRNPQGLQEAYSFSSINGGAGYGVLPDGSFLMARGPSGMHQQEIVLVQNWFSELPMASGP